MTSSPAAKILIGVTPDDHREIARFVLDGDRVTALYASPAMRSSIEGSGIYSDGRTLRPSDGRPFWDALDGAYSTSSFIKVRPAHAPVAEPARQNFADNDDPLTDDDLDALRDLDVDPPAWNLPTDDDGGSLDESADSDLRRDEADLWRADDHGYNPNRDGDGRFAPGPHHDKPHGAQRQWRLAFDAREHQKAMEAHKAAETVHRAKSMQIGKRMAEVKAKAEAATPKERAALRRRYESLSAMREEHRKAAGAAKEARVQVGKDLEAARSAHAAERKAAVAERTEGEWSRRRAEAESFMTIGRHSIGTGVGADESPAAPARHEIATRAHVTEAEAHGALQRARATNEHQSASMAAEQERAALHERLGVGKQVSNYDPRNPDARQVVSYEQPKRTQAEFNLHDQLKREHQRASDDRAEARNRNMSAEERQRNAEAHQQAHAQSEMRRVARDLPDGEFTPVPLQQALPHPPSAVAKARNFLRSLLGG